MKQSVSYGRLHPQPSNQHTIGYLIDIVGIYMCDTNLMDGIILLLKDTATL